MDWVTVVIETPRHSIGKYFYDEEKQCFRLKKILPLGMTFPYDFGMIKNTNAEDGDPIDAMVISECDTYPGVELECRIIGALLAKQKDQGEKTVRNDRYFCIPKDSVLFEHMDDIKDFSKKHNEQLESFFINYNKVENKNFDTLKFIDASQAKKLLGKKLHGNDLTN
ncbi:MAG TPA: inorganic diphosphatase [Chitinophagaceae bacterium]|nr:inorganic diphosphatase [Chitinophagaceae bacterium]